MYDEVVQIQCKLCKNSASCAGAIEDLLSTCKCMNMQCTHHFRVMGVDCAILFFVASLLFFFGAASRTKEDSLECLHTLKHQGEYNMQFSPC